MAMANIHFTSAMPYEKCNQKESALCRDEKLTGTPKGMGTCMYFMLELE